MKIKKFMIMVAVTTLLGGLAFADTLTFNSGQVIYGVFQGRSSEGVQFLGPDGHVKVYPFSEVQNLTFGPIPQAQPAAPTPQPQMVQVPSGTVLIGPHESNARYERSAIRADLCPSLATNLAANGFVVAPSGTNVYGQIVEANSAKRGSGKSQLKIQLTQIVINGNPVPIVTSVFDSEGKSSTKRSFRRLLGGAGLELLSVALPEMQGWGSNRRCVWRRAGGRSER